MDKQFVQIGKRIFNLSSITSIVLVDDREYDFNMGKDVEYQVIKIHFVPETPHLYTKSIESEYTEALVIYNYIQSNLVMTLLETIPPDIELAIESFAQAYAGTPEMYKAELDHYLKQLLEAGPK